MTYLSWYLGIGIVVLTKLFINHKIRRRCEPRSFHDMLEATNPDHDRIFHKILNGVVIPLLVICVWPLVFFYDDSRALPTWE
jgi:hypothetical protein